MSRYVAEIRKLLASYALWLLVVLWPDRNRRFCEAFKALAKEMLR